MKRIFLCGPSGVGKTTLANELSKRFNIPFVDNSELRKPLWEKYKIKHHSDLIARSVLDPVWGKQYQDELLNSRLYAWNAQTGDFITDRGPIDSIYYFLYELSHTIDQTRTKEFIVRAIDALRNNFTHSIYVHYTPDIPEIKGDGKRIENKYFQQFVALGMRTLFMEIMNEIPSVKGMIISGWDLQKRIEASTKFLSNLTLDLNPNGRPAGIIRPLKKNQ